MTSNSQRLAQLGIELPKVTAAVGAYVSGRKVGNLLFISGQLPMKDGVLLATGQVPSRCSVTQAIEAARQCAINALAAAQAAMGSIDRIKGVIRVGAFVSSDASFTEQPKIANGASEFVVQVFGEPGRHARAAVGANTLPLDAAVEVEFLFEIESEPESNKGPRPDEKSI